MRGAHYHATFHMGGNLAGGRANNMNQNQQFTLISLRNILLGDGDRDMICDVRAFLFIFKKVKCKIRIVYEKDFMRFYK